MVLEPAKGVAQPWGGVVTKTEGEGSGHGRVGVGRELAASNSRLPPRGCFLHTSLFMRVLYIIFWPWGLLTFYDLGE